jgi:hypothetical protein
VRSILLEEKEHLREMERELAALSVSDEILELSCALEGEICGRWLQNIQNDIFRPAF